VDDAVLSLSETIAQQECVLVLGDENMRDKARRSGQTPTKNELLYHLRNSRSYIAEGMTLADALYMKEVTEGRNAVLTFLREQSPIQLREPLAAHLEIARLPFRALITTNWDSLVERAYDRLGIPYQIIVEDDDVPLIRSDKLPIIKLYGTIDRALVYGTEDELHDFASSHPLLSSFIRVMCARKTLLLMGYDLADPDFMRLFRMIKREVARHAPVSYIVHPAPTVLTAAYWSKVDMHVVAADPIDFAQRLNAQILLASGTATGQVAGDESIWMDNALFRPLLEIRTLPTESQVIDGVLTNTLRILDSDESLESIGELVIHSMERLATYRPNYAALAVLATNKMVRWFPPYTRSKDEVRIKIEREMEERRQGRDLIGEKGAQVIEPGDRLLLYVHSTRVVACVNTWLRKNPRRVSDLEAIIP